jgi:hypothetical protein
MSPSEPAYSLVSHDERAVHRAHRVGSGAATAGVEHRERLAAHALEDALRHEAAAVPPDVDDQRLLVDLGVEPGVERDHAVGAHVRQVDVADLAAGLLADVLAVAADPVGVAQPALGAHRVDHDVAGAGEVRARVDGEHDVLVGEVVECREQRLAGAERAVVDHQQDIVDPDVDAGLVERRADAVGRIAAVDPGHLVADALAHGVDPEHAGRHLRQLGARIAAEDVGVRGRQLAEQVEARRQLAAPSAWPRPPRRSRAPTRHPVLDRGRRSDHRREPDGNVRNFKGMYIRPVFECVVSRWGYRTRTPLGFCCHVAATRIGGRRDQRGGTENPVPRKPAWSLQGREMVEHLGLR